MNPVTWREVERIYHAALELDREHRSEFVRNACGGDEKLCAEVESLLEYETKAKAFMESPAANHAGEFSVVADVVRRSRQSFEPGRFVGRVFGMYELKALIGAGGMGEVYRALDTRLDRIVAIKILPEYLGNDAEYRERFRREARIVSSLNHPHICALFDIGTQDGVDYLVMEYVDGETLERRLQRGRLPLAQSTEILTQIVDALDKASRRGVVHRDLKPANVMLTPAGVKLLDFGAATWLPSRGGAAPDSSAAHRSHTLTVDGVIIGTLQYMSPEQLKGMPADTRTDIFAVGVIGYEIITGRKAFDGATQVELIGSILRDEPSPIADLVPGVPAPLARALERCLSKDPDERWQSANDLLFHLRSLSSSAATTVLAPGHRRMSRWLERAVWTATVVASVLLASHFVRSRHAPAGGSAVSDVPVRFSFFPAEGAFLSGTDVPFALSPDGRQIAYVGTAADGIKRIWIRSLYTEQQHAMAGTEGANTPFWSPDSEWLGFFAANSLKKIRVSSGLTQIVATGVSTFGGAAWNADDDVIFPGFRGGLSRVSARGGPISQLTIEQGNHFSPHFLRDGKHFIYAAGVSGAIRVGSLAGEPPRTLMTFPVRVSTLGYSPGFVFFVQDSTLFAAHFDEQRLELSGKPMRLVDGMPLTTPARAPFSVSAAGVLAYWPYTLGTPAVLRWHERSGVVSAAVNAPAQYRGFALSPDDRQLVFSRISRTGAADLWLLDFTRSSEVQLTFEGAAFSPQWSPDATRIAFSGYSQAPPPQLFVRPVSGSRPAVRVGASLLTNFASAWSADGRSLVTVRTQDPANRHDVWIHRLEDGAAERAAFNTAFNEWHGKVSPDGRWIAYTTDKSGTDQVMVATFPSGESPRQISSGGGTFPQWAAGGNEVLYVSPDKQLMSVPLHVGHSGLEAGAPKALFRVPTVIDVDPLLWPTVNAYLPTSNGHRFLVAESSRDPGAPPISVIVNWSALLGR